MGVEENLSPLQDVSLMSVLDTQSLYWLGELRLCSWYSDKATGWMASGLNPSRSKRFFSSPNHPCGLWGISCLLFSKY